MLIAECLKLENAGDGSLGCRALAAARGEALLITVLEPALRAQVSVAGRGVFDVVHTSSLQEATVAARDRRVTSVLISPSVVRPEDLPLVSRLATQFVGAVVLVQNENGTHSSPQDILALGRCGIREIVDLSARTGWNRVRELAVEPYPNVKRALRAAIIPELSTATAEVVHFFEVLLRQAPSITTVRELAQVLGVSPSTMMSRFLRHQLPAPKRYLSAARLLYAAALLELRGASIADVANRLEYSSSQSFGRHVRTMLKMTASDFRWRYSFERSVEEFTERLIAPYRGVFASFWPIMGVSAAAIKADSRLVEAEGSRSA